jgi:hypothetical protein
MTPTNAFWIALAPDESGVALPERTVELDPAADEAAVAELEPLAALVHPASASAAAATAATAAGHRRQGGEPGGRRPDGWGRDGGEGEFFTMHHYRTSRA